jgi:hypothetical protein
MLENGSMTVKVMNAADTYATIEGMLKAVSLCGACRNYMYSADQWPLAERESAWS